MIWPQIIMQQIVSPMCSLKLSSGAKQRKHTLMKDILTIIDPVRISYIEALLKEAGIPYFIRDGHMADLLGQRNGLFPRRLAVDDDDVMQAERILRNADQWFDE